MNVLILGGTQFVGRHIAEALVLAGHHLTIFNRGKTPDTLTGIIERLRGDRDLDGDGLAVLAGRNWDACVDVSGYTSRQVRSSAMLLAGQVRRYVFISAVSVYGDPHETPVTEDFPRSAPAGDAVTEIDSTTYGPLKVACENIVEETYVRRCTIVRPQIVSGPFDPLDRFAYWVRRAGQAGTMLAPGDGLDHLQYIDARDVARFAVGVIEQDIPGCFNLAGPRLTWAEFIKLLDARNIAWVPAEVIRRAGVTEFELPLYRQDGGPRSSLMCVSNERAIAAGLTLTSPAVTIADTRAWLAGNDRLEPALSPDREAELIRRASDR
jgi:2'-hydroxyisoflavone reductase